MTKLQKLSKTWDKNFAWLWFSYHETIRRKGLFERDFCSTYILSYPRSGNHAARFAMEFLSDRPTLGEGDHESFAFPYNRNDSPIFLRSPDITISAPLPQPVAIKRHKLRDIDVVEKLIYIERNIVEAVLSHAGGGSEDDLKVGVRHWKSLRDDFNQFPEDRKLLIDFDEILKGERHWFERLADFLEWEISAEKLSKLESLIADAKKVLERPAKTTSADMYANQSPDEASFVARFAAEIGADRCR